MIDTDDPVRVLLQGVVSAFIRLLQGLLPLVEALLGTRLFEFLLMPGGEFLLPLVGPSHLYTGTIEITPHEIVYRIERMQHDLFEVLALIGHDLLVDEQGAGLGGGPAGGNDRLVFMLPDPAGGFFELEGTLFEEALALENGCPFHADQDLVAASCRLFGENGKRGPVVPGHDRCTCRRRLEGIVLEARAAAARDQEAKNGESRSLRYLHVVPTPSPRKKPPFRGSPEAPGKRRPVQNAIPRPAMTPRRLWYPTPILNHSIT
ncbi:MAG: hypothetical protein BWX71_01764 [Deltaproteobacteria bacterium ADurb.Bin072]|nr:MAG: hypothetical protein BWX71_01764 [Deltaproteobacteria bacterium ADurb.Bin072]